ncbi:FAD-dependent oxidoreductase [Paraburkholderia sp. GAS42]|uniref:FAD-dependent oxidoreductase n=1 Tax=Paraburkholderia sp. GAS42 TaxID=3035135 RepID=UPI003D21574A
MATKDRCNENTGSERLPDEGFDTTRPSRDTGSIHVKISSLPGREWDFDVSDSTKENQIPSRHVSIEQRLPQMFPQISSQRIERARRYGTIERFEAGQIIYRMGERSLGVRILLSGTARLTRRDGLGNTHFWMELGEGHFLGETGQLTGKPHLADAHAVTDVEALLISPGKLRRLMIEEAYIGEQMMRALILRRAGLVQEGIGPVLIGPLKNPKLVALEAFFRRVTHPYRIVDSDTGFDVSVLADPPPGGNNVWPIVALTNGTTLVDPSETELAGALGLLPEFDDSHVYDVAVVGAGPAGLATAVYAASEGLSVVVFDTQGPGGQASASARIENYLGFPTGISGHALSYRAFMQAVKFGAEIATPSEVTGLSCGASPYELSLRSGDVIKSRVVVIASGAAYRKPDIEGLDLVRTHGVYYWASAIEGHLCEDRDVVVIGGGNSAGQAIVFLSSFARRIHVIVRRGSLEVSMSRYLVDRIAALDNVSLHLNAVVRAAHVDEEGLSGLVVAGADGEQLLETRHLFLFVGAEPNTAWLAQCGVAVDERGFVFTGQRSHGAAVQTCFPFETNVPGVFAVGDVRSSSVKRVSAAVGEGATVVTEIHSFFAHNTQVGAAG